MSEPTYSSNGDALRQTSKALLKNKVNLLQNTIEERTCEEDTLLSQMKDEASLEKECPFEATSIEMRSVSGVPDATHLLLDAAVASEDRTP